ncbi:MAG: endonuclease/exonuclease/phosphatase family protein [Candidatus Omnitrophica bacterium]|nr:endonuclease/exonuclease/phosphatase family protein [Candidatus Omnitrophota bacterium]
MDCWGALAVLVLLASLGTVAGFLGRVWWLFELACHFRAHYFTVLAAGTLASTAGQRYDEAIVSGLLALANAGSILALYLPRQPARPDHRRTVRVWLLNVNFHSRAYGRTLQAIHDADPDLIVLMEVSRTWMEALRPLQARYPHGSHLILERGFGIALFSRVPLTRVEIRSVGPADLPSVIAHLVVEGHPLTLIGTHPLAPQSAQFTRLRDEQMLELARLAASQADAVMLAGDFNTTSWSTAFAEVLKVSGLRDSRLGFGLQPTWPAWLAPLRIPIDHALVSPQLIVRRRRVGPHVGSDHLPVLVEVSWAEAPA